MRVRLSLRVRAPALLSALLTVLASECIPLPDHHECRERSSACVDAGRSQDSCSLEYEACED